MQASSSTVFITGATGFIGQRLVSALLEQGVRVRAMIRPGKETDKRIPQACEQVSVDLTDVDTLTGIVAECTAVIYCAGSVRGRNLTDFSVANIMGVKAMLEALEQSQSPPPLLLLSSLAASRPELSDYAKSKYEGEKVLQGTNVPWTIFRPPAVYGPGDREMLPILKMIRRGVLAHAGPINQQLSLLHVDDLVSAVTTWLSAPQKCLHKTYAIDDGTRGGYSWEDIGEAVSDRRFHVMKVPDFVLNGAAGINLLISGLLGYAPMLTPGKVRELVQSEWLCDNTDYTEATGWQPQVVLKQGTEQLFKSQDDA